MKTVLVVSSIVLVVVTHGARMDDGSGLSGAVSQAQIDEEHRQHGPLPNRIVDSIHKYWDAVRAPTGTNYRCNELNNVWIQAGPNETTRTRTVLVFTAITVLFFIAITFFVRRALQSKGIVDTRILFHAARSPIWLLFLSVSIFGGVVEGWFISKHFLPIEELHCFNVGFFFIIGFLLFIGLLVNDIIWFAFVFHNLRDKASLVLHHAVYLALALCTIFGVVEYVPLFYCCCALEESGELISSISYLSKDGSHAFFWFVFRSLWRLATYSFAIGITGLFILFGQLSLLVHYFMLTATLLWIYFLISDFIYFLQRVQPLDDVKMQCCSCSKRNSKRGENSQFTPPVHMEQNADGNEAN